MYGRPPRVKLDISIRIKHHNETHCKERSIVFTNQDQNYLRHPNLHIMLELTVKRGEPSFIPPAEETQKGLYYLSSIDRNNAMTVPTLYVFKHNDQGNVKAAEVIKDALSKVLVHYYPLAGRMAVDTEGKLTVDCTGEGAVFVEAEANASIEIIGDLRKPDFSVTKFECGGFVVGLYTNHCILDGFGGMQFINSWGETARGLPLQINPHLDRSILKPRNPPKIEFPHHEFDQIEDISNTINLDKEDLIHKSFIFDPEQLKQLKIKVMEDGDLAKCSSFEALVALTWKLRTKALSLHPNQRIKLLFAVDGRSRFDPPIPHGYFGNCVVHTYVISSAGEISENPISSTVRLVLEAIGKVTDKYIRSVIDYIELNRLQPSLSATLMISTWCKLPFDSTDFGWGVPHVSGLATVVESKEIILFLAHGSDRKSINVLVSLPASAIKIFEELMIDLFELLRVENEGFMDETFFVEIDGV
ncbi:hypothetical protein RJ639_039446 [Escallonia herrerae]|uniref:Uncharacterized protein n=1 Tax=Escallonia herrerae TaxID=1293975 RepID=A0AA89B8H9_9ASTE|nr:hypothetical protein RJ639_039446 [Escallonia herrerae]